MYKSCSFFGHREIEELQNVKSKLIDIIETLIKEDYRYFYFGGFGEFDDLCYQIVSEKKKKYPYIKRIFCLYDARHKKRDKRPKWLLNEEYEEYVYFDMEYDYWYTRIYYRNIEILKKSDFCIFYSKEKKNSGAYKLLQYAKKNKYNYINII